MRAENSMDNEELLTGADAARYLGLTRSAVNKLAHEGKLGRQIAGRFYVFTRVELDAYRKKPKHKGGRPRKTVQSVKTTESA